MLHIISNQFDIVCGCMTINLSSGPHTCICISHW